MLHHSAHKKSELQTIATRKIIYPLKLKRGNRNYFTITLLTRVFLSSDITKK